MSFVADQARLADSPLPDRSACDQEPIHIPGAIQPHGVLLFLSAEDLTILHASENSRALLGRPVDEMLGRRLGDVLGPEIVRGVELGRNHTDDLPSPLWIPIELGERRVVFDGILHRLPEGLLLELENPRPEQDFARDGRRLVDSHYRLIQETLARITRSQSIQHVAQSVTEEVRRFTGFDRVMLYRFEESGHGIVIAESRAHDVDSYLNLYFPASDIPAQARKLYELNWLRLIADVNYTPVPLHAVDTWSQQPLDLSKSVLRSVSPVHLQYLKNMQVGASMSISLMRGDRLWGLIACHHREARFVDYSTRAACVLFGAVLSAQIVALEQSLLSEDRSRRQTFLSELQKAIMESGGVTAAFLAEPERSLAFLRASGLAASFGGNSTLIGSTPPPKIIEVISKRLDVEGVPDVFTTTELGRLVPEIGRHLGTACGLLAIRFASGDHLLFFRPELVRTVNWAGNPYKAAVRDFQAPPERSPDGRTTDRHTVDRRAADHHHSVEGRGVEGRGVEGRAAGNRGSASWISAAHRHAVEDPATALPPGLHPRSSFDVWAEQVRGHSAAWTAMEIQLAEQLRTALSAHILRQAEELATLNRQLAQKNDEISQFLYTVSHDLKSPLITCRGFIGLLREDLQEQRTEDLEDFARRVDEAAGHMAHMLDDLLELYRLGRAIRTPRPVALRPFLTEMLRDFDVQFAKAGAVVQIEEPLPEMVFADLMALRRILNNLVSNAVKYGCSGADKRIMFLGRTTDAETLLAVRDFGPGVPPQQREKVFQLFQRFAPPHIEGSGLGLASVVKLMRLHGGRVWVEDSPGGGATFWTAFPHSSHRSRLTESLVKDG